MSWWMQPIRDTIIDVRMDSDHFHPKFAAVQQSIRSTRNAVRLRTLLSTPARRGVSPAYSPDGDVLVLNSQFIGEYLINTSGAPRSTREFWKSKPRAQVKQLDVLMNSTGVGTIGRVNCAFHSEKSIADNHVTVLRVLEGAIDPRYLAVFLNSPLGRSQAYMWQSGSSGQLELYPSEIEEFWVLVPDPDVQRRIGDQLERADAELRRAEASAAAAASSVAALLTRGERQGEAEPRS